jgi:mRNA interferase HigB
MKIFTPKTLNAAMVAFPDAESSLKAWSKIAKHAHWTSFVDTKKSFGSADYVTPYTVFDIRHNKYRLITKIEYRFQMIFIKNFLTHADYDKGGWRK